MNNENHFLLFSTCIPVKGAEISLIMDLDRGSFLEIPNTLYDILTANLFECTIGEIKSLFNNDYDEGINQYFQFLVDSHYGFYTSNTTPFQKLPLHFDSPHKIISSVVAIHKESNYDLGNVFQQLNQLGCQLLQIRVYDEVAVTQIITALEVLKKSSIRIIELYIPAALKLTDEVLKNILIDFRSVLITIYGAEKSSKVDLLKSSSRFIRYTNQQLLYNSKEAYAPDHFTVSHEMYLEAVNYNSGLYRKVCVDHTGTIKNYLSHKAVFGNVQDTKISDVIQTKEFNEKYYLKNDVIEKCKDCQFRYMCLSNSDIKIKDKKYYKIDTCNYDPYKNIWESSN